MKRAKLRGLKRNAALVLGNLQRASHAEYTELHAEYTELVETLTRACDDDEPLVREHVAWALARLRR